MLSRYHFPSSKPVFHRVPLDWMPPSIVDSHKKLLEPGSSNVGCEVRLVAKGTEICDADKINHEMRETVFRCYVFRQLVFMYAV